MVMKKTSKDQVRGARDGIHCDLCGSSAPAVSCDKCSQQTFCLSCDDMYHRHPKRRSHVRRAVDVPVIMMPPPPVKVNIQGMSSDPARLPIPPPRRRKSQKSVPPSPLFGRRADQNPPLPKKEFSFLDKVGSLRRLMVGRPLPPVPKDEAPARPPKTGLFQNTLSSPTRLSQSESIDMDTNQHVSHGGYSNSSRQSPAGFNDQFVGMQGTDQQVSDWEDASRSQIGTDEWNPLTRSAYPSDLNRSDSGISSGFQGFPTMPKPGRAAYIHPSQQFDRMNTSTPMSTSVSDIQNQSGRRHLHMGLQSLPQAQSYQHLNYSSGQYIEGCQVCRHTPWIPHHHPRQNMYPPYCYPPMYPPEMKRTPSTSSMDYPGSDAGFGLNSYTSMGHLHHYQQYPQSQPPPVHQHHQIAKSVRPVSPTMSIRSARHKTRSEASDLASIQGYRRGRRATTHVFGGRRSVVDATSSEDDYFSAGASDEEEGEDFISTRSGPRAVKRPGPRQWQCEHCTYINPNSVNICTICCRTSNHQRTTASGRRKHVPRSTKSKGESRDSAIAQSSRRENHASTPLSAETDESLSQMIDASLDLDQEESALSHQDTSKAAFNNNGHDVGIGSTPSPELSAPALTAIGQSTNQTSTELIKLTSKGTSPPPQSISTQTGPGESSDKNHAVPSHSPPPAHDLEQPLPTGSLRRTSSTLISSGNYDQNWNSYQHRSSSRPSLYPDSREVSPPQFRGYDPLARTDYYLSLEDLVQRRRQEKMRTQGFELVRLLREAEQNNFTADDLQVALNHCGNQNPVQWLQDNWKNTVDTVVALVTNYGKDKPDNDIGIISADEAKAALRVQKGNVWASVTECVETRQKKFAELRARGDSSREEIVAALTANQGNVEAAWLELSKNALKPFHMRIWGPPMGVENESGAPGPLAKDSGKEVEEEPAVQNGIVNGEKPGPSRPSPATTPALKTISDLPSWTQAKTHGGSAVGGSFITDTVNGNDADNFQPSTSSRRLSRTGSFSGGSYHDRTSVHHTTPVQPIPKPKPADDLYVTVQWVNGNKPSADNMQPRPNATSKEPIYATAQMLEEKIPVRKPLSPVSNSYSTVQFLTMQDERRAAVIVSDESRKQVQNVSRAKGIIDESLYASMEFIANQEPRIARPASPAPFKLASPVKPVVPVPSPPLRTESSKMSPQREFERRARALLAEGCVPSYEQAELAIRLLDFKFVEEDAFLAASACYDLDTALSYLQQDCELCTDKYPMNKMVYMLNCTHRCCQDCARAWFSFQIRDRNIVEVICPFCSEPDLDDDDVAQEYFNNLDILLKGIITPDIHELFQRKVRDRTLRRDPNFHWCTQCSSGFIANPHYKKLTCPDCRQITCAQCRKLWASQHEGISCEKFSEWQEANDPEFQARGLEKHLEENGIDCPSCKFRYSLAKGGCMHFRCLQCKFDFCSGCGRSFKMGEKCNFSPYCAKLGLHAHHPRNCLFYLRDKDPAVLQQLLQEHGVQFDTESKNVTIPDEELATTTVPLRKKCLVMEQKEVPGGGLRDNICGNNVDPVHAGLCRLHYVEYLVGLVNRNGVDPLSVYDEAELRQELRRRGFDTPERLENQTDTEICGQLIKIIREKIPLDETSRK